MKTRTMQTIAGMMILMAAVFSISSLGFAQATPPVVTPPVVTPPDQSQPAVPLPDPTKNQKAATQPVVPLPSPKEKTMKLESESFANDTALPKEFTADGAGQSPALKWTGAPKTTVSFAIMMDDPNARGFVHWIVWGIPATQTSLPANMPRDLELKEPAGARQGVTSWGRERPGYWGSAPSAGSGVHRYTFTLYALDTNLKLDPGSSPKNFKKAIEGHVLMTATLVGLYERK